MSATPLPAGSSSNAPCGGPQHSLWLVGRGVAGGDSGTVAAHGAALVESEMEFLDEFAKIRGALLACCRPLKACCRCASRWRRDACLFFMAGLWRILTVS